MVRGSDHQTQGRRAQIISAAAHEGRSRYCVMPPTGTATAATYAAAGGASYERTRRKVPSAPTTANATFTDVVRTSRCEVAVASRPIPTVSGDQAPHCPSAAIPPARHAWGATG